MCSNKLTFHLDLLQYTSVSFSVVKGEPLGKSSVLLNGCTNRKPPSVFPLVFPSFGPSLVTPLVVHSVLPTATLSFDRSYRFLFGYSIGQLICPSLSVSFRLVCRLLHRLH